MAYSHVDRWSSTTHLLLRLLHSSIRTAPKQPARVLLPISYLHDLFSLPLCKASDFRIGSNSHLTTWNQRGFEAFFAIHLRSRWDQRTCLTRISASGAHFAARDFDHFALGSSIIHGVRTLFAPCMHVFRVDCTDEKSCHRTFNNREVHKPPSFVPDTRRISGQVRSEKRSGWLLTGNPPRGYADIFTLTNSFEDFCTPLAY
jgi:hypothetical protein